MESYEEILERMRRRYAEESGSLPEDVSDIGLRLRVLAGELYRMQAEIDWLKRQAFPQTAVGKQLDLHGAQRGVIRREAAYARGTVSFTRYLPLDFDLVIPKGTLCATSGEEAVEYETLEDAVLKAGALEVEAEARAVLGGAGGNAAAGYVTTLATPIVGINYATNKAPFTGGAERESDGEYRVRVLGAYSRAANCGNADFYEEAALSVEGVSSAQAVPRKDGAGTVSVYLWGVEGAPEDGAVTEAARLLAEQREIGVTVSVKAAEALEVHVYARVRPAAGTEFQRAAEDVKTALAAWFASRKVGDPMYLADLSRVILAAAPVEKLEFPMNMRDISPISGTIPVPGIIQVDKLS